VIRHGTFRAGQDDTEDEKGDEGIVQVEYRVYARDLEGMYHDPIGNGDVDTSGRGKQLVRLVSLVVLLAGLFLAVQSDQLSQWKRLVSWIPSIPCSS
jgi:hypothetical protein